MRQFLITKFVCSACGKNLSIQHAPKNAGEYAEGQPTGADMVEQRVAVEPCTCCTKPLEEVRAAVRKIINTIAREPEE